MLVILQASSPIAIRPDVAMIGDRAREDVPGEAECQGDRRPGMEDGVGEKFGDDQSHVVDEIVRTPLDEDFLDDSAGFADALGLTKRPDVHHVRALCVLYGVTDATLVEAMVTLARDARKRGWWSAYKDVLTGSYVGLEAEASSIRTFQLGLIPGLLQTAEYTAEITRSAMIREPREIERRVEARLERQQILIRSDPPQLWAIIDEAALLRLPPGVREPQLRKLIGTSPLEHVKLQVLPMSAGPHAGLKGHFVILDFPDPTDRSVVYLETATDGLYLEETEQVNRYTLVFQHLCASALSVDASITYLSTLLD